MRFLVQSIFHELQYLSRWIVMNKPVYVTKQQLYLLRKLMQGDDANPKAPMWDNFRPPLPLNRRVTWTNIDFHNNNKVRIGQKANIFCMFLLSEFFVIELR